MGIIATVFYIVVCVLLFALAILVHEFGHFVVALSLGLRVEAFSIGFGKAIWKKRIRGVEYRLSCLPLGGYVSIPDVDPEGTKALEGAPGGAAAKSAPIPPWKEIAVAVAGPAMNVVLAVVLAVVLSLAPGAKFGTTEPVVDIVPDGTPAAKAGFIPGDRVVSVNGREVNTWTDLQTEVQITGGKEAVFMVERGEAMVALPTTPERDQVTGALFIGAVNTNSCGATAWMPSRNPVRQLAWDAGAIFRVLKGLTTPKEAKATAGALGGPVMIAEGIYRSLRHSTWDGVGFLRFLNVNLAVLNLLPIPVLDGGLILFSLIALVFRRRVPEPVVRMVSMFFMYLLIALMGLLVVKDSMRSWRIHTRKAKIAEVVEDIQEASTNAADNARD
ncbi:MAG: site-2 protease family protein [Kiritimatiellae bacterium]|nr:site-2 protease family protein [Kiritimatiellia bacterium]